MQGEVGSRGGVPGSVLAELSGCRRVSATSYCDRTCPHPQRVPRAAGTLAPTPVGGSVSENGVR